MRAAVAAGALGEGADGLRARIGAAATGTLELARPPLDDLPYRSLVRALLAGQGFKLDFRGKSPDAAVALLCDQLLGRDAFARERTLFAADIDTLGQLMHALVGGAPPQVALRSYFAPGDLVWHLDRVNERRALRLVWPIGRPAGMRVTTADNIDAAGYRAYMRREHALLCALDSHVAFRGGVPETLWAHRPEQLRALRDGAFPFVRDPARQWEIRPGHASIHHVDTPVQPGTYHRSTWANRTAPGLQLVITAVAD